jgi:hypothetical protein
MQQKYRIATPAAVVCLDPGRFAPGVTKVVAIAQIFIVNIPIRASGRNHRAAATDHKKVAGLDRHACAQRDAT